MPPAPEDLKTAATNPLSDPMNDSLSEPNASTIPAAHVKPPPQASHDIVTPLPAMGPNSATPQQPMVPPMAPSTATPLPPMALPMAPDKLVVPDRGQASQTGRPVYTLCQRSSDAVEPLYNEINGFWKGLQPMLQQKPHCQQFVIRCLTARVQAINDEHEDPLLIFLVLSWLHSANLAIRDFRGPPVVTVAGFGDLSMQIGASPSHTHLSDTRVLESILDHATCGCLALLFSAGGGVWVKTNDMLHHLFGYSELELHAMCRTSPLQPLVYFVSRLQWPTWAQHIARAFRMADMNGQSICQTQLQCVGKNAQPFLCNIKGHIQFRESQQGLNNTACLLPPVDQAAFWYFTPTPETIAPGLQSLYLNGAEPTPVPPNAMPSTAASLPNQLGGMGEEEAVDQRHNGYKVEPDLEDGLFKELNLMWADPLLADPTMEPCSLSSGLETTPPMAIAVPPGATTNPQASLSPPNSTSMPHNATQSSTSWPQPPQDPTTTMGMPTSMWPQALPNPQPHYYSAPYTQSTAPIHSAPYTHFAQPHAPGPHGPNAPGPHGPNAPRAPPHGPQGRMQVGPPPAHGNQNDAGGLNGGVLQGTMLPSTMAHAVQGAPIAQGSLIASTGSTPAFCGAPPPNGDVLHLVEDPMHLHLPQAGQQPGQGVEWMLQTFDHEKEAVMRSSMPESWSTATT